MPPPEPHLSVELPALSGDERFSTGQTVLDFWRWTLGDLRMNTARGFLAEFLVAQAVRSKAPTRVEWAAHDVNAEDGTRLEVKSSGYLQSWTQARPSTPSYAFKSVGATRVWNEARGEYVEVDPDSRIDAWVFALQNCRHPDAYDPLDVNQWEFRVVPHRRLLASGQKSARLSFFDRIGVEPSGFGGLADAVHKACVANRTVSTT